jgi:hypothetical protein
MLAIPRACLVNRSRPWTHRTVAALVIGLAALLSGCAASVQLAATQPSAVGQQLVVRSLERALMQLDLTRMAGRRVAVELFAQTGSQAFVKEFVIGWLQARGVRVTSESPELKVKVLVAAVGSDRGETFVGIPSLQAPVIGVPLPEIALFKWARNRGLSELLVHVFDGSTDALVETIGPGIGNSKRDDFTVLMFIGFGVSDLDKRPPPPEPARGRP